MFTLMHISTRIIQVYYKLTELCEGINMPDNVLKYNLYKYSRSKFRNFTIINFSFSQAVGVI